MKMRKHRQLFRISFLGLAALMLMSVGVMFFNTHASEAVSDSDLAASSSDLASGGIHRSPVSSRPSVSESDAAGKTQKAVTQGKTAETKHGAYFLYGARPQSWLYH